MRHTVRLSLLASIIALSANGADDLAGMFKEGKASGQARAFFRPRLLRVFRVDRRRAATSSPFVPAAKRGRACALRKSQAGLFVRLEGGEKNGRGPPSAGSGHPLSCDRNHELQRP